MAKYRASLLSLGAHVWSCLPSVRYLTIKSLRGHIKISWRLVRRPGTHPPTFKWGHFPEFLGCHAQRVPRWLCPLGLVDPRSGPRPRVLSTGAPQHPWDIDSRAAGGNPAPPFTRGVTAHKTTSPSSPHSLNGKVGTTRVTSGFIRSFQDFTGLVPKGLRASAVPCEELRKCYRWSLSLLPSLFFLPSFSLPSTEFCGYK